MFNIKLNRIEKTTVKHICLLSVIFLFVNWFLLIISGVWWDDWAFYSRNVELVHEVMRQQSLPLEAYILRSVWWLPNGGYRVVVFLLFYFGSLLLYGVLRRTSVFNDQASFWITALYIAAPINDARVTLICYGYSLGLFSFWLAFYLTTLWYEKTGRTKIILRIITVIVLVFSFNTESNMAMTLIILLWLYYMDLRLLTDYWKDLQGVVKKFIKIVFKYIDYLLVPIVFYFGKHILFPGYGAYQTHNYVDWQSLPEIIRHAPQYVYRTFMNLLKNYNPEEGKKIILLVILTAAIIALFILWRGKRINNSGNKQEQGNSINYLILLVLGLIVFCIGLFPYMIVRKGPISTIYVEGRDSMLLGIGIALIIYYSVALVLKDKFHVVVYLIAIILGAIHLNKCYFDFQEDFYYQLQFQKEVASNKDIQTGENLLCILEYPSPCSRFYQLNANSYVATGSLNKFYLQGVKDLKLLIDFNPLFLGAGYNMWEYNPDNKTLDGIIYINNRPISDGDLLRLKWREIIDSDYFEEWIAASRDIEFVTLSEEESDAIIEAYKNGVLTDDNISDYITVE